VCSPHERRPQEEIFGRIARGRELGEEDEIGPGGARVGEAREDLVAVSVEVADDGIQLCNREPQGFRLTVTNLS
jgi:hypothetical protein